MKKLFKTEFTLDKYIQFAKQVKDRETIIELEDCYEIIPSPPLEKEQIIEDLRYLRAEKCFSIINRGQLWYNTLTPSQHKELEEWYHKWLDVTDTLIEPATPLWITE